MDVLDRDAVASEPVEVSLGDAVFIGKLVAGHGQGPRRLRDRDDRRQEALPLLQRVALRRRQELVAARLGRGGLVAAPHLLDLSVALEALPQHRPQRVLGLLGTLGHELAPQPQEAVALVELAVPVVLHLPSLRLLLARDKA